MTIDLHTATYVFKSNIEKLLASSDEAYKLESELGELGFCWGSNNRTFVQLKDMVQIVLNSENNFSIKTKNKVEQFLMPLITSGSIIYVDLEN